MRYSSKRMDRFGKLLNRCTFHPSQAVVGICSLCLRERLVSLARANYEQRRGEKNYKPDSLSWGYLPFQKRNYDDIEEIRDNDQRAKIKTQNYNSSDEKKGKKVNFSGLRSFLGFLRKRDCRNNVSVRGRRENELQRRQDRSGDVQDLFVPCVTKTGCPTSTKRSVSERRLTARPYFKGPALRRSTSYHDERDHEEMEDTLEPIRMKLRDGSETNPNYFWEIENTIESIRMKLSNGSENDLGFHLCGFPRQCAEPRSQMQNERLGDLGFHGGPVRNDFLPSNKSWELMIVTFTTMVVILIWEAKIDSAILEARLGSWFCSEI